MTKEEIKACEERLSKARMLTDRIEALENLLNCLLRDDRGWLKVTWSKWPSDDLAERFRTFSSFTREMTDTLLASAMADIVKKDLDDYRNQLKAL